MTLTHPPVLFRPDEAIAADSTLIIHRPRRRRWWPAAVAASATVALVAVGAVGVRQLTAPALSFDGGATVWRTAPDDDAGVHRVDNLFGSEVTVGFERAGAFSAQVALVNHGRYPVKVQGLPDRGAYYYGLESVEMALEADGAPQPFHSFTLRRGATRWLVLHFRFADCDLDHGEQVAASRTSLPVDYRIYGVHRKEAVPLRHFALSVPTGHCDHPVL
ncbi:MAG: hypothetical protein QOD57_3987 [Actinomycetota bacterium]|jgi:hypothetical protein|nr:hypothetical protein [Actinomycetota bacterium]MDQ1506260.1 hypothetical protein [Actinomycetota bacterium]